MLLSERIKFVRRKLLLTQSQLAKETGISEITIARWESGREINPQMISYGRFLAFCERMNIFFDEEGELLCIK